MDLSHYFDKGRWFVTYPYATIGSSMKWQVSKGHAQCIWPSGPLDTCHIFFCYHLTLYVVIVAYKYVANPLALTN